MRTALAIACSLLLALACDDQSPRPGPASEKNQVDVRASEKPAGQQPDEDPLCTVELRSWVVLARGRHLYLDCDCPEPFTHLNRRIEYTKITLRTDHDSSVRSHLQDVQQVENPPNEGHSDPPKNAQSPPENPAETPSSGASNIARMTPGRRLYPIISNERDRLETTYKLPVETVEFLQRDRIFSSDYALLGPNSNSGIRKVMQEAELELPWWVLAGEGALGEYPGISMDPGEDVPNEQWPDLGIPDGPVQLVSPQNDAPAPERGYPLDPE